MSGTIATFWIGCPDDPGRSNWLGNKQFDGYPTTHDNSGYGIYLDGIKTKNEFKRRVKEIYSNKPEEFWLPTEYIYKWDPRRTEFTYIWYNNKVFVQKFNLYWKMWGDRTPWDPSIRRSMDRTPRR